MADCAGQRESSGVGPAFALRGPSGPVVPADLSTGTFVRKTGVDAGFELFPIPCNGLDDVHRASAASRYAGHGRFRRVRLLPHGTDGAELYAGGGAAGRRCAVSAGLPAAALAGDGAAGAGRQRARFRHPCRRGYLRLALLAGSGAQPASCGWPLERVAILDFGRDSWCRPAGLLLHGTAGARWRDP